MTLCRDSFQYFAFFLFSCTGNMIDNFQMVGNLPSRRDLLKSNVNGWNNELVHRFRTQKGIPSELGDVENFILEIAYSTCYWLTIKFLSSHALVGVSLHTSVACWAEAVKLLNALWKWVAKSSHFLEGEHATSWSRNISTGSPLSFRLELTKVQNCLGFLRRLSCVLRE